MSAPSEEIYLFVNPKSGGNKGQDFLKVPQPFLSYVEDGRLVALHIFSLIDPAQRAAGFAKLKAATDAARRRIRTIVGGGDGTVMWVDSEAAKVGIDTPKRLAYGIVPLGTGNDFSRVAGWGGKNPKKILDNDFHALRNLLKLWCKASWRPHDVWNASLEVDESEGQIFKVVDKSEEQQSGTTLSMPFINYFSIGQESQVGVNFDKYRTRSQTCNLFVYACSGVTTQMNCRKIQHVADLISGLHAGADVDAPVLFGYDEEHDLPQIMGNPESLMFLNVNSYAGGMGRFWQQDADYGTDPHPPPEEVDVGADPGDGRLEVVTLPCIVDIALDMVSHEAKRVHSGGPYYLEFFGPPEGYDCQEIYGEIDGEFFHLVNPLVAHVTFTKRLQVLQNMDDPDIAEWKQYLSPSVWMAQGADVVEGAGQTIAGGVSTLVGAVATSVTSGATGVVKAPVHWANGVQRTIGQWTSGKSAARELAANAGPDSPGSPDMRASSSGE